MDTTLQDIPNTICYLDDIFGIVKNDDDWKLKGGAIMIVK